MSELYLSFDEAPLDRVSINTFPGGEVNIKLPDISIPYCSVVHITAKITDSNGVMSLLLLKDALNRELKYGECYLHLGYVPYARQDRVCSKGESLSIKVFTDLINSMNFNLVNIIDPHSDVTPVLINNSSTVYQHDLVMRIPAISTRLYDKAGLTIVAPDYGATKKVEKLLKIVGRSDYIQGYKKRNPDTGELSGFGFYGNVKDKDLLIVDDICDGGGTFVGLAEELKTEGAKSVSLFVTHGIFSRGINTLLDNGIDIIYTTDSLPTKFVYPNFFVLTLLGE